MPLCKHVCCTHTGTHHLCMTEDVAIQWERDQRELTKLAGQLSELGNFIMNEVPGEPSQSEGVVDTAIRIMRAQQQRNASYRALVETRREAMDMLTPHDGPLTPVQQRTFEDEMEENKRRAHAFLDAFNALLKEHNIVVSPSDELDTLWIVGNGGKSGWDSLMVKATWNNEETQYVIRQEST